MVGFVWNALYIPLNGQIKIYGLSQKHKKKKNTVK